MSVRTLFSSWLAIRWEIIAAVASSIGALASAAVAIYALTYVSRQEEIAREQLKATYQSNLYTKQIDSFSAFYSAVDEWRHLIRADGLFGPKLTDIEVAAYQERVKERYESYAEKLEEVYARKATIELISPSWLSAANLNLTTPMSGLLSLLRNFRVVTPNVKAWEKLKEDYQRPTAEIRKLESNIFSCVGTMLKEGKPLAQSHSCDLGLPRE